MKHIGADSGLTNRKIIAEWNGMKNYNGQSQQNIELLQKLKNWHLIKSIINESNPSSDIIYYPAWNKNELSLVKNLGSIGVDSSNKIEKR